MEAIVSHSLDDQTMLLLVGGGDTSRLNPTQKLAYYNARCEAAGLDPRAQPFEFIKLGSKEQLYARKAATDQLASKHGIRVEILSQVTEHEIRVVTVRAIAKDGRQTDEIGAVPVKGLVGEFLANAMMKAITKAKRRAILSLCGLGMMDETEAESIPGAQPIPSIPPVARTVALPEPDATQRAAEAIVEQVQAAQPQPDVPPKARVRRDALWMRLVGTGKGQLGMNATKAAFWMTRGLKSLKPIKSVDDLTDEQLSQLEEAFAHDFGD